MVLFGCCGFWKLVLIFNLCAIPSTHGKIHKDAKSKVRPDVGGQKRMHAAGTQPDLKAAKPMEFEKCSVAADNELCSKMGVEIFRKGGTAADAVVTTQCCVEVVNSHSTGIGGGGFMVYYDRKSGNSTSYDFRETLPKAYKSSGKTNQGDRILVPGILKGLLAVWRDYGKLKWADLWKPCIDLAKKGFAVHASLANAIMGKESYIRSNKGLRLLYAPNGKLLKLGETLKRPILAKTYETIAAKGGDFFYKGAMAKTVAADVKQAGGKMTLKDLEEYTVNRANPLKSKVKGLTILSMPAPGSGALITLALKIIAQFKWTPENQHEEQSLKLHQMIEAFKMAYAPYSYLGDPNFTDNQQQVQKYMLDDETALNMFNKIDGTSHTVSYYKPYNEVQQPENTGTTHISLIDPFGNGLGATTSINAYFGSKFRSEKLGFIYNNELSDFNNFWPEVYNLNIDKKIPGKRPMSKASPTLFLDGKGNCVGVFGAGGGFFIPTAIIQTISNWLFYKNNLKIAVSKPRLHCQLFPPTIVYEDTFPQQWLNELKQYNHIKMTNKTVQVTGQLNAIMGVVQAVVRLKNGKLNADSDYRKGGKPAGY